MDVSNFYLHTVCKILLQFIHTNLCKYLPWLMVEKKNCELFAIIGDLRQTAQEVLN